MNINGKQERHLEMEDFFLLAVPPAGEPEPLPSHLSSCDRCTRQLTQWKAALSSLAPGEAEAPEGFEKDVMAKIRSLRTPRSRRLRRRAQAGLAAAASLVLAFWLGTRLHRRPPRENIAATSVMSPADQRDDRLLRDVSRLVEGEDSSAWKSLAPLPDLPQSEGSI